WSRQASPTSPRWRVASTRGSRPICRWPKASAEPGFPFRRKGCCVLPPSERRAERSERARNAARGCAFTHRAAPGTSPGAGASTPSQAKGGVDSTLKCNGIEVEEYFVGGEIAETFARPLIEQVLDGLKFLDGDGAEVARTREKLAEQAVEVLVATPLPRAVGVSEVNLGVKRVLQPAVLGKLGTAVAGQGVALLDERIQAVPDAGRHDLGCGAGAPAEAGQPCASLDQGHQHPATTRRVHRIDLPVADQLATVHPKRTGVD